MTLTMQQRIDNMLAKHGGRPQQQPVTVVNQPAYTPSMGYKLTKPLHDSSWAVGMTVARRERPTVRDTVETLADAGWKYPYLFAEPNANDLPTENVIVLHNETVLGNWGNFCHRLNYLLQLETDMILLVQDDVEFLRNTRTWLENNWPCNEGCVTLYRPTGYDRPEGVVRLEDSVYDLLPPAKPFLGMLALAMTRNTAQSLLVNLEAMTDGNPNQDDIKFGKFCSAVGIPINVVKQSRCQHTGMTSSIYTHTRSISKSRKSGTYVKGGEV